MGFLILLLVIVVFVIVAAAIKVYTMTPGQMNEYLNNDMYGQINSQMVCPHCQTIGTVRTKAIAQNDELNAREAIIAVASEGLSLFLPKSPQQEKTTQSHCDKCGNTWTF